LTESCFSGREIERCLRDLKSEAVGTKDEHILPVPCLICILMSEVGSVVAGEVAGEKFAAKCGPDISSPGIGFDVYRVISRENSVSKCT
jgi:hypothetical protein